MNAGYPVKLGQVTYVCSYDYVTEFQGKVQGNIDMLTDPDIVPYPPANYAGTSNSPIARYKRFCSGG